MTQENNTENLNNGVEKSSRIKTNKSKALSFFKIAFLVILITILIGTGIVGGMIYATIKDIPPIDASNIDALLNQNSFILDQQGNIIEKVLAEENRTAESIDNMPIYLQKAFISIEDERFDDHFGVDLRGIAAALVEDVKAGASVRGASTITQQLAKNVYLTNEKSIKRKIKEAYIAIKLEQQLTKSQILESYLNKIYLGQGAYGVKEAAFTYFSKEDLSELTIAESALIAGVTKNPSKLSPYSTIKPQDVLENTPTVGTVELSGEKFLAVFNEESIVRQRIILNKMKELGHISESEYRDALAEDMYEALNPGKKVFTDISSYFVDYVKQQVMEDLMASKNITQEEAQRELLTGGLRIYSTVDLGLQKDIEDMYTNFSNLVFSGRRGSTWSTDRLGNIIDSYKNVVYYKKSSVLDESGNLFIEPGDYVLGDNGLTINSYKLNVYPKNIDIKDYYTLDGGHLVAHNIGSLDLKPGQYKVDENKAITISHEFLKKVKDFYTIDGGNNLVISSDFFLDDEVGIVQPQSATVIVDHSNGQLKALVGGRNFEGSKILNRALTARQPGSAIKPIAAYLPALDRGYNAGTGIDDSPLKDVDGKPWPRNSYSGYRGVIPVREAIRDSSNAAAVRAVEDIGVNTSKEYLKRMGVIKQNEKDSFITRLEDKRRNDENSSALGLGGMTRGISPLDMAGAYASIANNGSYIKPIAYTRVEDSYGNIVLENKPKKTNVVSPGVAYVMTDMLKDVVTSGTGRRARVSGVDVAGKTGTTSNNTDAWFVGYSPQYTASIWIGNDSPAVKLPNGSMLAAQFWSKVMTRVHRDVPRESFIEPDDIVRASVCTMSGKIPTASCYRDYRNTVKTEIFARGHEPSGTCDYNHSKSIPIVRPKRNNDVDTDKNKEKDKPTVDENKDEVPEENKEKTDSDKPKVDENKDKKPEENKDKTESDKNKVENIIDNLVNPDKKAE